jgi:thiamine pyrophosphate-dependent acetolactate synthase large subunit-like protein
LLPYAEEKAAFAAAIEARVESLPQVMVVHTGTPGAKDALGVLIPRAVEIVRAIR